MKRSEYEFPIDEIAQRPKADAPAGIYLLGGRWHLAAHDTLDEVLLVEAGALLVATLTFTAPARPADVASVPAATLLHLHTASAC